MAETHDRLLTWSLATFHTTLLLAVLLSLGHATGSLGDLLSGLGTLSGFALFAILWVAALWTNRRWLDEVSLLGPDVDGWHVIKRGAIWGAPTGVVFVLGFLAIFVLREANTSAQLTLDMILGAVGVIALVAVVGSLFATVVGAIIGGLLAALDLGLVRVTAVFVPNGRDAGRQL